MDALGPFSGNVNDAQILEEILKDPKRLKNRMEAGDYCIVDRWFRDNKESSEAAGYIVLKPYLKGNRKQQPRRCGVHCPGRLGPFGIQGVFLTAHSYATYTETGYSISLDQ